VTLERIGCHTQEDVDEPIVADDGEQRLFVRQRIGRNDFRSRVRNLNRDEIRVRHDAADLGKPERVARGADPFDCPLKPGGWVARIFGARSSVADGIDDIANILWQLDFQRCRC